MEPVDDFLVLNNNFSQWRKINLLRGGEALACNHKYIIHMIIANITCTYFLRLTQGGEYALTLLSMPQKQCIIFTISSCTVGRNL